MTNVLDMCLGVAMGLCVIFSVLTLLGLAAWGILYAVGTIWHRFALRKIARATPQAGPVVKAIRAVS